MYVILLLVSEPGWMVTDPLLFSVTTVPLEDLQQHVVSMYIAQVWQCVPGRLAEHTACGESQALQFACCILQGVMLTVCKA